MKQYVWTSIKLTFILILICSVVYPLLIAGIARFAPGGGGGEKLLANGRVVGYANIGQKFTEDRYFWGRPSAVDYNAAGSGGSNKAPSNPEYLRMLQDRVDSFLVHNPGIKKNQVPAEMVTASGSGLDPDISPQGAGIQAGRVARSRMLPLDLVQQLIKRQTEKPLLGPAHVNVLKLNIELDKLK
jgi:K+-transporting ATPase ATPase C chain